MFFAEPVHVYSGISETQKPYTPLKMRKQPSVDQGTKPAQQKPGNNCLFGYLIGWMVGWFVDNLVRRFVGENGTLLLG